MTSPAVGAGYPQQGAQQAAQSSGAQNPSGIELPATGDSSSASQYGLGTLRDILVNLNGSMVPAEDVIARLLQQSSPDQIAQLQSWLYKGGGYGSKPPPNLGVWSKDDIAALSDAVSVAAQTQVPVLDFIKRQAAYGVYSGIAGAVGSRSTASRSAEPSQITIEQQDPKALAQMVDREFKALTGRKATDAERAGFVAAFNAAHRAAEIAAHEARYGVQDNGVDVPGAPLPPTYLEEAPQPGKSGALDPVGSAAHGMQFGLANEAYIQAHGGGGLLSQIRMGAQNIQNVAENNRRYAADQDFLSLADQPIPGAGGGSTFDTGGASVRTVQGWDPDAFAEDYVRSHATGEVGAHDMSDKFSMFLSLLKGVQ